MAANMDHFDVIIMAIVAQYFKSMQSEGLQKQNNKDFAEIKLKCHISMGFGKRSSNREIILIIYQG